MSYAFEGERSPFIPPYRVGTLWWEQIGLLGAESVSAGQMLRRLAELVNEEIQRNVKSDPVVRKRYEAALAKEKESAE